MKTLLLLSAIILVTFSFTTQDYIYCVAKIDLKCDDDCFRSIYGIQEDKESPVHKNQSCIDFQDFFNKQSSDDSEWPQEQEISFNNCQNEIIQNLRNPKAIQFQKNLQSCGPIQDRPTLSKIKCKVFDC